MASGAQRVEWPDGPLHVWIDGYPTDRRRRDADGLLSSLKAALDGIAKAMGVDDSRFVPHPWIKDEVRKGGEVRIRVTSSPLLEEGMNPITCATCAWFQPDDINPGEGMGQCKHENRYVPWHALVPHQCRDHESNEGLNDAE